MNESNATSLRISPVFAMRNCIQIVLGSEDLLEVCRRLVHSNILSESTFGAWILKIQNGTVLIELAGYGKPFQDGMAEIPLWDDNPISNSVRLKKFIFEPSGGDSEDFSIGAIPLLVNEVPIAVCVLVMSPDTKASPVDSEVFETLGDLMGSLFARQATQKSISSKPLESAADLTSRQILILGYMSEGMTNLEISNRVLVSESTVRQETIRIYRSLGVANRSDAVSEARKQGIIPTIL